MSRVGIVLEVTDHATPTFKRIADAAVASAKVEQEAFEKARLGGEQSINKLAAAWETQHKRVQSMNVGNVVAQDYAKVETSFKKLQSQLGTVDGALSRAGVNTGMLGQVIGALTSPLGLAAVAVGALTGGLLTVTNAMIRNAQEVKALMAVSGLEAEAADNLADTFQLLGKDSAVLTSALFKMAQEIDTGGVGLRKLGLSFEDVIGTANEGELFLLVRDKISAMGSATQRSAALMDVFGRSGRDLAPIFALSRGEFRKFMDEAGALSPWSAEMQKRTQELIIEQTKLGMVWDGLKLRVGELVTGPLTKLLEITRKLFTAQEELTSVQLEDLWSKRAIGYGEYLAKRRALDEAAAATTAKGLAAQRAGERVLDEVSNDQKKKMLELRALHAKAVAESALSRTLGLLAIEETARQAQMQNGGLMAAEAAQQRIKAVDVELAAKLKALDAELAAVKNKEDLKGTAAIAVQAKITAAHQEATAKRIALTAAAERAQRDYDERIRTVSIDALAKYEKATDGLTRRFEAQARVEAVLEDQAGVYIKKLSDIDAAQRDVGDSVSDLDKAFAKLRGGSNQLEDQLRLEADALGLTGAAAAAAKLSHDLFGRSLANLGVEERNEVDRRVALQREGRRLVEISDLIARGYSQEQAAQIAMTMSALNDRQKQRMADGDYFGFLGGEFERAGLAGKTMYEGLATVARETVANMTAAVSDFFFNFVTGTASAGEAFENFGKAVLRSITNLLAEQAVKQLLEIGKPVVAAAVSTLSQFAGPAISAIASLFAHQGGVVGKDVGLGLGPDERAVVMQTGEAVLPRDLTERLQGILGGGDLITNLNAALAGTYFAGAPSGRQAKYFRGEAQQVIGPNTNVWDEAAQMWVEHPVFKLGSPAYDALLAAWQFSRPGGTGPTGGGSGVFSFPSSQIGGAGAAGVGGVGSIGVNMNAPNFTLGQTALSLGQSLFGTAAVGPFSVGNALMSVASAFVPGLGTIDALFFAFNRSLHALTNFLVSANVPGVNGPFTGPNLNLSDTELASLGIMTNAMNAINDAAARGESVLGGAAASLGFGSGMNMGAGLGGDNGANLNVNAFARGGTVPGAYPGQPRTVTAHAGEEFMGVGQWRRSSGPTIVNHFHFTVESGDDRWIRDNARKIAGAVEDAMKNRRVRS